MTAIARLRRRLTPLPGIHTPWFQASGFTRQRGTDRFWRKVAKPAPPDACWTWLNGRSGSGYGVFRWRGKVVYAHVLAWRLVHNTDVPAGMVVRHSCDNPLCCRPSHLHLGTHRENMRDMADRGRVRCHVLAPDQVRELRRRFATGEPRRQLQAAYGISQRAFHYIVSGRSYARLLQEAA